MAADAVRHQELLLQLWQVVLCVYRQALQSTGIRAYQAYL